MSFGRSRSRSSSSNRAFDFLQNTFGGQAQQGVGASNALAALLGVGGTAEDQSNQNAAFQNYLNSAGYRFQLDQGQNAIASSSAAGGLLNSGSTLRRLASYGQGLASNYLQQYLAQLSGLSNSGLQAGSLIGQAGQTSSNRASSFNFGF